MKTCDFCRRRKLKGFTKSFANNRHRRFYKLNLINIRLPINSKPNFKFRICTRCYRTSKKKLKK